MNELKCEVIAVLGTNGPVQKNIALVLNNDFDPFKNGILYPSSKKLAAIVLTKLINIISYRVFDTIFRRTFKFDK